MPSESSSIVLDGEPSRRQKPGDSWVIIDGACYDVTPFLDVHPGGKQVILEALQCNGADLTDAFSGDAAMHDHSKSAWKLLEQYKIGTVGGGGDRTVQSAGHKASQVNMTQAVLPQVLKMPPKNYQPWIMSSHEVHPNLRIFESNFWEGMSHWPWWYIFPLWVPMICATLYWSLLDRSVTTTVLSYATGVLCWTFVEYLIHRYLFHVSTSSVAGNFYHFFAHGIHHLSPLDSTRLTFPPWFGVVIATLSYRGVTNLCSPATLNIGYAWYAGMLSMYVLYDTMHFWYHHYHDNFHWLPAPLLRYFLRQKTRHNRHHFHDAEKNFGVTSPLFDIIFGTTD